MSKNEQAGTTSTPVDTAWADALEEQRESAGATGVTDGAKAIASDLNLVMDIPVRMTVELGRTRMTIKELLALSQGSVVALEGLAGEPLDILINGYLIAQGEVVVVSDKFGIRITDIITPSERIYRLSR